MVNFYFLEVNISFSENPGTGASGADQTAYGGIYAWLEALLDIGHSRGHEQLNWCIKKRISGKPILLLSDTFSF